MPWSDEELEKMFLNLTEQSLGIERELLAQRAALTVLRSYVASIQKPDRPAEVLELLRRLEKRLLDSDSTFQAKGGLAQTIELLQKHGKIPGGEA